MASHGAVFTWTFDQAFAPITAPPADATTTSRLGTQATAADKTGVEGYTVQ